MHTEVRWLSKGNCLARFVNLFDSIVEFFEDQTTFCEELKKVKTDALYLAGLYRMFNEVNLQLQGKKVTLIDCKKAISAFIDKLGLFRQNFLRKEFYQFHYPKFKIFQRRT